MNVDHLAHLICTQMMLTDNVSLVTIPVVNVLVHMNGNVSHSVQNQDTTKLHTVLKIVDYITMLIEPLSIVKLVVTLVLLVTDQDVMVIVILVLKVTSYIMDNV